MKKFLFLTFVLLSSPAFAEWTKISSSKRLQMYADLKTIRKTGSISRVWKLSNYNEKTPEGILSTRSYMEYDCIEQRSRVLQEIWWSDSWAQGKDVTPQNIDYSGWSYIAPDTLGEDMLNLVCR